MKKIYRLEVKQAVHKELQRIPNKYADQIRLAFVHLTFNPYIGKPLDGKYKGMFSLKVWPYRIIYEILHEEITILVIKIGHRKDVYR